MKTEQIKRIEVHTVMLQEGTGYQSEDLVPDRIFPGVRMLPDENCSKSQRNICLTAAAGEVRFFRTTRISIVSVLNLNAR